MARPLDESAYTFAHGDSLRDAGGMLVLFASPARAQQMARTVEDHPQVVQVRVREAPRHEKPDYYALTVRSWWRPPGLWGMALGASQAFATRDEAEKSAKGIGCRVTPVKVERVPWAGETAEWPQP
jgi:hypothetical protein